MPKVRIYELAKMLKIENKELIEKLKELGIDAKSHMSVLTEEDAAVVMEMFDTKQNTITAQEKTEQQTEQVEQQQYDVTEKKQENQENQNHKKGKNKKEKNHSQQNYNQQQKIEQPEQSEEEDVAVKYIGENPTVKELAEVLGKNASEIVKLLMKKGIMAGINQNVEFYMSFAIA